MNARVWTTADVSEPMPPLLPVLVYGLRVPLLRRYIRELRYGLIFWFVIATLIFHATYLNALEFAALSLWPSVPLALMAYFGRGLPSLRVEMEALYFEDDGRKRAAYWREIGPMRYREVDGQPQLWWRPRDDELALPPVERANSNRAREHILQIPAASYFADPAREGPAFAAYLNRIREHFVASDHQLP